MRVGGKCEKLSDGRKIVECSHDDFVKILRLKCCRNNVSKGINLICELGISEKLMPQRYGEKINYYTFTKNEYERRCCGKVSAKRGMKPVDCKNYRATI